MGLLCPLCPDTDLWWHRHRYLHAGYVSVDTTWWHGTACSCICYVPTLLCLDSRIHTPAVFQPYHIAACSVPQEHPLAMYIIGLFLHLQCPSAVGTSTPVCTCALSSVPVLPHGSLGSLLVCIIT